MELASESSALGVLRKRFGFSSFRAGQAEIVHAVLTGRDALGVMPTGGGKSLGYALPALLLEAPVLVVSPLIALMKDQVDQLRARGITAEYVNSTVPGVDQKRRIAEWKQGRIRLLFVAPERFRSERFLEAIQGFRPGLFAVDEAHCIAEWGHDFRPDYLRLKEAAAALSRPPILALTATATREVRKQIIDNLGLVDPEIVVRGFERPNLDLEVTRYANKTEKLDRIIELARAHTRGIVYAATRKSVEEVTLELKRAKLPATAYHAGMLDLQRRKVSEDFASGAAPLIVATNAFGMGIDRPDVRFVAHYEMPGSIEAYTQEAGRAGRDGAPAQCVLTFTPQDVRLQHFFIDSSYPDSVVIDQTMNFVERTGAGGRALLESALVPLVTAAKNGREVDSALRILAEAGSITRGFDPELRDRVVKFVERRPIDYVSLHHRRDRERQRLQDMLDYAERGGCHRARLVDYFAGITNSPPCGTCGGCRKGAKRRPANVGETEIALTLLNLVCDLNGRYGRKKLIGILQGSKAKSITDVRAIRSRYFGALSHLQGAFLEALLQECIEQGLLEIEGGEYPVITLGYRGREAIRGREPIELSCFDQHVSHKRR